VFDWLFEGHLSVYVLLAVAAGVALFYWRRNRKRPPLIIALCFLGLIALYFILDKAIETDGEQIARKIREMAAAVERRDLDALFAHVADDFRSPRGKTKAMLRQYTQDKLAQFRVREVVVWDLHVRAIDRAAGRAQVVLRFKPKGDEIPPLEFLCEAEFALDAQHGWRLQTCRFGGPGGIGGDMLQDF
jgi:hypothetical protein